MKSGLTLTGRTHVEKSTQSSLKPPVTMDTQNRSDIESNHASLLLDIALIAVHGHQVPLRQHRAGVRLGHPGLADPDGAPWRPRWRWLTRNVADVAALAAMSTAFIPFGDGRGPLSTRRGPQLLPVAVQEGLDQI